CLYYHMGQCLAPCVNKVDETIYDGLFEQIKSFLEGHDDSIKRKLKEQMIAHAEKQEYEKAGEIKQTLDAIDHVVSKQLVEIKDKVDRDVFSYTTRDGYLSLALLTFRRGILLGKEVFIVEEFGELEEQIEELILHYYSTHQLPKEIVINLPSIKEDIESIYDVNVVSPTKGVLFEQITIANLNAKQELDSHFQSARLEDDVAGLLEDLGVRLGIKTPYRIELFDNSHLQGSDAIGAMVCFINGEKAKKMYRKFIIQHDEKRDDFASMKEVIKRRYERLKNENKDFPDLILVDGGENQITAAKEALKEINIAIPLAGLYKDNKHNTKGLINENYEIINIEEKTPLYFMLVRMQDEVHRFAIRFHRESRSKSMFNSYFDNIDGLGERRKQILLERYPSLNDIRVATTEELAQLVPIEVAKRIKEKIT
ncbi:MAG: excinuclease ABC subunit C, partial [Bacilli bacterium]|nr:excinuclease ABC subunit C [Bacilli bacterium]